jgi:hypothetical protein
MTALNYQAFGLTKLMQTQKWWCYKRSFFSLFPSCYVCAMYLIMLKRTLQYCTGLESTTSAGVMHLNRRTLCGHPCCVVKCLRPLSQRKEAPHRTCMIPHFIMAKSETPFTYARARATTERQGVLIGAPSSWPSQSLCRCEECVQCCRRPADIGHYSSRCFRSSSCAAWYILAWYILACPVPSDLLRHCPGPCFVPLRQRPISGTSAAGTSAAWTSAAWTSAAWTSAAWTSAAWTCISQA